MLVADAESNRKTNSDQDSDKQEKKEPTFPPS
jgi:hypothetical protein